MDPAMSLIIVVIISFTTLPLLKNAGMILLQNPPPGINLIALREEVCRVRAELHFIIISSRTISQSRMLLLLSF